MAHDLLPPHAPAKGECRATALRIVAADGDPAMCRFYQQTLAALGHQVCVTGSGRQAVELCRLGQPDLVMADIRLPDLDGLAVAGEVCRRRPVPFIVVSDRSDPDLIHSAPDGLILAYLVKPITADDLRPAIAVAMLCFQRLQGLWEETSRLRQALEDRKLVERAKGLVMRYSGLGEGEAFQRLQKLASDNNRKVIEAAQSVVEAGEVFHQLELAEAPEADERHPRPLPSPGSPASGRRPQASRRARRALCQTQHGLGRENLPPIREDCHAGPKQ